MRWQTWLIGALLAVIGLGSYYRYNHRYDNDLRAVGALYVDRQLEDRGVPDNVRTAIFHQACCDQPRPRAWKHEGKNVFSYKTENGTWYGSESPKFDLLPRAGTMMFYASEGKGPIYAVRVEERTYKVVAVSIL